MIQSTLQKTATILKLLVLFILSLSACSEESNEAKVSGRWYTETQIYEGKKLFASHCSSCHGIDAGGTSNWKRKLADGSYPPPPLDGTAHAWHHSMSVLIRTIDNGGIPVGGKMPGFKDSFNDKEKFTLIAYFQSFWPDKTYHAWLQRGGMK